MYRKGIIMLALKEVGLMLTSSRFIFAEGIKRFLFYLLASFGSYLVVTLITYLFMPLLRKVIDVVNEVYAPVVMCIGFYAFLYFFLSQDKVHIRKECTSEKGFDSSGSKALVKFYFILSLVSFCFFQLVTMHVVYYKKVTLIRAIAVPSFIPMLMQNNIVIGYILSLVLFSFVSFIGLIIPVLKKTAGRNVAYRAFK